MDSIEGAEASAITEAEAAEVAGLQEAPVAPEGGVEVVEAQPLPEGIPGPAPDAPEFPSPPEGAVPLFLDPPEGAPAPMPATTEAGSTLAAADEAGPNPHTGSGDDPGPPDAWRAMMEGRLAALEKAAGIRPDAV